MIYQYNYKKGIRSHYYHVGIYYFSGTVGGTAM